MKNALLSSFSWFSQAFAGFGKIAPKVQKTSPRCSQKRAKLPNLNSKIAILGTSRLQEARLFTFGDRDGPLKSALLQHPLAVVYWRDRLFVADTYNNKIKEIDLNNKTIGSLKDRVESENSGHATKYVGRSLAAAMMEPALPSSSLYSYEGFRL